MNASALTVARAYVRSCRSPSAAHGALRARRGDSQGLPRSVCEAMQSCHATRHAQAEGFAFTAPETGHRKSAPGALFAHERGLPSRVGVRELTRISRALPVAMNGLVKGILGGQCGHCGPAQSIPGS